MEKIEKQLFDERNSKPRVGEQNQNVHYVECRFWGSQFVDCLWEKCTFLRVKFAHGVVFRNCVFRNVRFRSPHTFLEGDFIDCRFEDCILHSTSIRDAKFTGCFFSGEIKSVLFFGKGRPKDERTVFKNVDMTQVIFKDTSFRCDVNLKTVQLPENDGGYFIND